MAIDNLPTNDDQSRLSGAYIRTLANHLSSSKPAPNTTILAHQEPPNLTMAKPKNQNVQGGHKKQVRRRLHTSRPYQERLLNMAEARKEIVTALKFHRASMKQANEKKQQQQQQLQLDYQTPERHPIIIPKVESPTPPLPYYPSFDNNNSNSNSNNYNDSYPWVISSLPSLLGEPLSSQKTQNYHETLNIPLPNQTLGLNLNLQAFANLDTSFCQNTNNTCSSFKYSSSTPMSPSSSSSTTPRDVLGTVSGEGVVGPTQLMMDNMHHCLDEEEMAKIRSIGEQHQIEWDDTLDLVKSAWWFKFLKTSVEFGKNNNNINNYYDNHNNINSSEYQFEELMEFPPWLDNPNDHRSLVQQQHMEDSSSEGTSLPWVDIGDIDGMDDEWLS